MIFDLALFHGRWDAKKLLLHQLSQTLPWDYNDANLPKVSDCHGYYYLFYLFPPLLKACILFLIKTNHMHGQEVLLSNMGMDAIWFIYHLGT